LIQFTLESNRAAALLAFGARTAVVAATLTAVASAATAPPPASISGLATAGVFAARGEAAFAAGFARLLTRTAAFTAETAALTARTTWAAGTTSATATMTALTLVPVSTRLAAGAMSGARAGGSGRGGVAAEQALEPAHEAAWLFCLDRSGRRRAGVTRRAGFEFAFFPMIARIPRLTRFALLAWIARLTSFAGIARVTGCALITGRLAWAATFRILGAFAAFPGGLKGRPIRAVDGLAAGGGRGGFPMHAWPLGLGGRENVEFRFADDFGFIRFRGRRGFVAQRR
jgi:hypothetical protein